MNQDGIWLSILDYANVKKTSISTIRRSIKSGHLKFREENGKYFIWTKNEYSLKKANLEEQLEVEFLKRKNRELEEELADLKMLLSVLENRNNYQAAKELPPIPEFEQ